MPARPPLVRAIVALILIAALAGAFVFAKRTWGSFLVLRSAYEVGMPAVGAIRAWMTLDYVATTYGVRVEALARRLGLPETAPADTVLRDVADERGLARIDMVREVQVAVADLRPASVGADAGPASEGLGDGFLAALLAYSYPALGLVLLLGAIGAPVPTGVATVLAGSLAAGGEMSWAVAGGLAVAASLLGDITGYGVGRLAGERLLARHGRLIGYSGHRKARIEWLFARWGGSTVLLTRTLVSHLSSLASLLAGASRYAFVPFVAYAVVGRVAWTAAYFGLGYFVGRDLDAGSGLLSSITGLLIFALVAGASARYLVGGASILVRRGG